MTDTNREGEDRHMTSTDGTELRRKTALEWVETAGPFGDWRCKACLSPLDPDMENKTLGEIVDELAAHFEVCDA